MKKPPNFSTSKGILSAILILWAILSLMPLYIMYTSSFTQVGVEFDVDDISLIPENANLDNYRNLIARTGSLAWIWLFNSFLVAAIPTMSKLFFDALAGYALAKMSFPGRRIIFWGVLTSLMVPQFVTLIPLYRMMFEFGWIDSYWALLFPGLASVSGVFLFKQFLSTLPGSLIDAARADGCSEFKIFWKIVMPLSKPAFAVMGIMSFVSSWNNYFWPYLVTNSRELFTFQVGLVSLIGVESASGGQTADYGVIMAGAVIASILPVVVFLLFQKYFVKGVTVGALKG
jgi:multiple sugar transport system permease protein|tara:strand:- start:40 stop:900 length:861 start_codon:yes stop_codon:yes gene_type:complete